jgi:hypothetical protein
MILSGLGIGAIGVAGAVILGATCPVCVVATPLDRHGLVRNGRSPSPPPTLRTRPKSRKPKRWHRAGDHDRFAHQTPILEEVCDEGLDGARDRICVGHLDAGSMRRVATTGRTAGSAVPGSRLVGGRRRRADSSGGMSGRTPVRLSAEHPPAGVVGECRAARSKRFVPAGSSATRRQCPSACSVDAVGVCVIDCSGGETRARSIPPGFAPHLRRNRRLRHGYRQLPRRLCVLARVQRR